MPISAEWDEGRGIWKLDPGERFSLDDIAELLEKNDWRGGRRFLWDLRELVQGPDSSVEVRQAVHLTEPSRALWAGARTAVVVARDVDFGIARMFQVFSEGLDMEYQIFRDLQTALAWLAEASGPDRASR